jgi:hypothetical protein
LYPLLSVYQRLRNILRQLWRAGPGIASPGLAIPRISQGKEHTMNLDDIRRDAEQLEIDMSTSEGLDLQKRSDHSIFFHSFTVADDPISIQAASIWLEDYRRQLASMDQYRTEQEPPRRMRSLRAVTRWFLLILLGALVVFLCLSLAPTIWIGGVFAFLMLISLSMVVIGLRLSPRRALRR